DRQDAEKDQNEFEMNELDQQILVLEKMLEDAAGFGGKASDINKSELTKMLKRIRDKMSTVYDKLAEEGLGAVAEHLRNSISASSGRAFIYEPGPGQAIQWDL
ncbi:MAG: hypothetical protein KDA68_05665, partial [Planctomycetaceae bacterium]|nr:hypothetical protein [Planctomycetaceae bacterium]